MGVFKIIELAVSVALKETVGKRDHFLVALAEKTHGVHHAGKEAGCKGATAESEHVNFVSLVSEHN